jgi:hypothetical protein
VISALKTAYPASTTPVVMTIGNRDCFPQSSAGIGTPDSLWLPVYRNLSSLWADYIPSDQLTSFHTYGSYVYPLTDHLYAVSFNSVLLAYMNPVAVSCMEVGSPGATLLAWLANTLDTIRARDSAATFFLIGHVPPTVGYWYKSCVFGYTQIIEKHRATIVAQFFGHKVSGVSCDICTVFDLFH